MGEHTLGPTGADLIAAERRRQIENHHHTIDEDVRYYVDERADELVWAAVAYAIPPAKRQLASNGTPIVWPWGRSSWRPSPDRIHELEKAGALIAAEIDRLQAGGEVAQP